MEQVLSSYGCQAKKKKNLNWDCTNPPCCECRRFVLLFFLPLWKYCLKDEPNSFAPPPGPQTSQWAPIAGWSEPLRRFSFDGCLNGSAAWRGIGSLETFLHFTSLWYGGSLIRPSFQSSLPRPCLICCLLFISPGCEKQRFSVMLGSERKGLGGKKRIVA